MHVDRVSSLYYTHFYAASSQPTFVDLLVNSIHPQPSRLLASRFVIMIFNKLLVALVLSAGFLDAAFAQSDGNGGGNQNDQNGQNNQDGNQNNQNGQNNQSGNTGTATSGNNAQAVLNPANIQTGSASDGQGQADGVKAGQAPSET